MIVCFESNSITVGYLSAAAAAAPLNRRFKLYLDELNLTESLTTIVVSLFICMVVVFVDSENSSKLKCEALFRKDNS